VQLKESTLRKKQNERRERTEGKIKMKYLKGRKTEIF
jgi:hypothetical protein